MKEKTPEPEVDESLLTPEQKAELAKPKVSKNWWILWGVLAALIIACVLVVIFL